MSNMGQILNSATMISAFGFRIDLAAWSAWSAVIESSGLSQLIRKYTPAKNK